MRKGILFFFALTLIFETLCFADTSPLRIGVVLPLSGKGAGVGVAIRNGMHMAYDKLPGSTRALLSMQFEDDGAEPRQSVSAVQRLLNGKNIDLIVTAFSSTGNAVVPITERANMPLISMAYDRGISDGKLNTFTFWIDVDDAAFAAVKEAEHRRYRKIAIVSSLHEGNIAMREKLMRAGAGRVDFPILEEVLLTEKDLNSHVLRIRTGPQVDGIALLMHPAHLGAFVRSLRANRVALPFFTLGGFEDKDVRIGAGNDLIGGWYSATEYSPWFLPAYREKYPKDSTFGAAFGHDAVLLLAEPALKGLRKAELSDHLRKAQVAGGAFSKVIANGKNGFSFPVVIKVVGKDGVD